MDCASEAAQRRWASPCAALTPRLMLAPEPTAFDAPWRGRGSLVLKVRESLRRLAVLDRGWASALVRCALSFSGALGPEEGLLAAYGLCRLLGGLATLSRLCAPLAVLRRASWSPVVWLRSCGKCLLGASCLAEHGPREGSLRLFEQKLRELLLGAVATFLLPPELLAVHLAVCSSLGLAARLRALLRRRSLCEEKA